MTHLIANRYALAQKIGSGGMGEVYRGIDQHTGSAVAIKTLKTDLASPQSIARFLREGEALRQLNHPNIVTLIDAVEEDQQHYLVMELVEGGALDERLRRGARMGMREALTLVLDLADALTRAHRLNIIHRDIKPGNVLLAHDGMPRLTDFGIAHVTGSDITESGSLMGTAAYVAPEVIQGQTADARSDVWSLGVMLFEMLAGRHPFDGESLGSVIYAILSQPVPDLEALAPEISPRLADLVNRMLAKNPDERIPRMRLVGAEIEAILAGDTLNTAAETARFDALPPVSRFATSSSASTHTISHNLPAQTTQFVGRESELNSLESLIYDPAVRLLTILAPGGMGKTRLSLELGSKLVHQPRADSPFENGLYFVDLAPLASVDSIIPTIAEAIGYAFASDGRPAHQQLVDTLREKSILLLMDNFEHLVEGRALVVELLQAAPGLKVLATSREKLNLNAETVFVLSGMDFPEWETPEDALEYAAVKLFMQSARRVRPDFQLGTGELTHVARICRLVHGTPLGILLSAAWLDALSLAEISEEIARSLDFLETEMQDVPERQRSLRAVFNYSWNLMTEDERQAFCRCSIFRGGFMREAGQAVSGVGLRPLTALVNKSLLWRDNATGRYEVHELLRQFAEEKLNARPERAAIDAAHSQYYAGLAAQFVPKLKGHGQLDALNTLEIEFENIRAAWNWAVQQGSAETISRMLESVTLFLTLRNRFMDGETLFKAARQRWNASGENPPLIAGQMLVRYPEPPPLKQFRRGLAIAEAHHDAVEIAFCRRLIGHRISHEEFNQVEGIPLLKESLAAYQALGDDYYTAQVMDDLGWSYQLAVELPRQHEIVLQSLSLRRALGDKIGMANSLRNLGGSVGGFFEPSGRAIQYWGEAKAISYEMDDRLGIAWNASLQACNLIFLGEFEQAYARLDEAEPHARHINDPVVKGFILSMRGVLRALHDEAYDESEQMLLASFPPHSQPDFRLTMMPFGMMILTLARRNASTLQSVIGLVMSVHPFNQVGFYVPMFACCVVARMVDEGRMADAAAIWHSAVHFGRSYADAPFPMAWANRWPLMIRLRARIEAALGQDIHSAGEGGPPWSQEDLQREVEKFIDDIQNHGFWN